RGRLVPGIGPTGAENLASGNYSLYLRSEGGIQFVGTVGEADLEALRVNDNAQVIGNWLAQATPSGSHLLFPARANVTGDDPSAAQQAYLFSAETGETVCVSCLRNGGEPIVSGESVLQPFVFADKPRRAITDDGRSAFF